MYCAVKGAFISTDNSLPWLLDPGCSGSCQKQRELILFLSTTEHTNLKGTLETQTQEGREKEMASCEPTASEENRTLLGRPSGKRSDSLKEAFHKDTRDHTELVVT